MPFHRGAQLQVVAQVSQRVNMLPVLPPTASVSMAPLQAFVATINPKISTSHITIATCLPKLKTCVHK